MQAVAGGGSLTVDLETQRVTGPDDLVVPFEFDSFARESLLQGLDDIALTLKREEQITDFERSHTAHVDTSALPV
jgi:3-isopropylmalate/(R)-2-methylmalate dehydratase small subunit